MPTGIYPRVTKYESEIDLDTNTMNLINQLKQHLPTYSLQSGIGYTHTYYLNKESLVITYQFGFGYFYKIKVIKLREDCKDE